MLLFNSKGRRFYCVIFIALLLVNVFIVTSILRVHASSPVIVSVTPLDGSTNVPLKTYPTIVFNEPVNPGTVAGSVNGVPIVPMQATFDATSQILRIDLGEMEYQKTYTVVIAGTLEDQSGNQMGSDYSFHFTTATGVSKRPTSTINVPDNPQPGTLTPSQEKQQATLGRETLTIR